MYIVSLSAQLGGKAGGAGPFGVKGFGVSFSSCDTLKPMESGLRDHYRTEAENQLMVCKGDHFQASGSMSVFLFSSHL